MSYALEVWDDARALLHVASAALDTLPALNAEFPGEYPLDGAPARQFLSDGQPSYDCPAMLAVHWQVVGEAPTGVEALASFQRVKSSRINTVGLVLTCVRCRPESLGEAEAPPVKDLNRAARQHMADGWVLWNAIWRAIVAEQLFRKCDGVEIQGGVADDPAGMVMGWKFQVVPIVGGYEPLPDYVAPLPEDLGFPTR